MLCKFENTAKVVMTPDMTELYGELKVLKHRIVLLLFFSHL